LLDLLLQEIKIETKNWLLIEFITLFEDKFSDDGHIAFFVREFCDIVDKN